MITRSALCTHSLPQGQGGVRNPIASTVTYLSEEPIGGPTLVTDQRLSSARLAVWTTFLLVHTRPSYHALTARVLPRAPAGKGLAHLPKA